MRMSSGALYHRVTTCFVNCLVKPRCWRNEEWKCVVRQWSIIQTLWPDDNHVPVWNQSWRDDPQTCLALAWIHRRCFRLPWSDSLWRGPQSSPIRNHKSWANNLHSAKCLLVSAANKDEWPLVDYQSSDALARYVNAQGCHLPNLDEWLTKSEYSSEQQPFDTEMSKTRMDDCETGWFHDKIPPILANKALTWMCSVVKYCGDIMSLYRSVSTSEEARYIGGWATALLKAKRIQYHCLLTFENEIQIVKVTQILRGRLHHIQ